MNNEVYNYVTSLSPLIELPLLRRSAFGTTLRSAFVVLVSIVLRLPCHAEQSKGLFTIDHSQL